MLPVAVILRVTETTQLPKLDDITGAVRDHQSDRSILSFQEYYEVVLKNPKRSFEVQRSTSKICSIIWSLRCCKAYWHGSTISSLRRRI